MLWLISGMLLWLCLVGSFRLGRFGVRHGIVVYRRGAVDGLAGLWDMLGGSILVLVSLASAPFVYLLTSAGMMYFLGLLINTQLIDTQMVSEDDVFVVAVLEILEVLVFLTLQ